MGDRIWNVFLWLDCRRAWIRRVVLTLLLYPCVIIFGCDGMHFLFLQTQPTMSWDELQTEISLERQRLDISPLVVIHLEMTGELGCSTQKYHLHDYMMRLSKACWHEDAIRHEMLHLMRFVHGDLVMKGRSRLGNDVRYWWVEEPLAVFYSIFHVRFDFWNSA